MNAVVKPTTELTILMPCLNEAETLAVCIQKARGFLDRAGIDGEVLIADNGSTDGSQAIAAEHGARVVGIRSRGYGAALLGGIEAARGRYVIMGDSDDSYDFSALEPFVEKLREGYQLVMGNRFRGAIKPGAMPPLHRYLGNPVLTAIGRLFFASPCGDFHCGLRGFDRRSMLELDLQASGHGVRERDGREGHGPQTARRRGADHPFAGRPQPAATLAQLARRMAPPPLLAPVQSALAVPLPGPCPVPRRAGGERLAAAAAAPCAAG